MSHKFYLQGRGFAGKKDFKKAKENYLKAKDNPYAEFELAKFKERGVEFPKNKENKQKASATYLRLAEKYDEPLFQYHAARCCYESVGMKQDLEQAIVLYQKAGTIPKAALALGKIFEDKNDLTNADKYYRQAADLAPAPLPSHYSKDEGLTADDNRFLADAIKRVAPLLIPHPEIIKPKQNKKSKPAKKEDKKSEQTPSNTTSSTADIQRRLAAQRQRLGTVNKDAKYLLQEQKLKQKLTDRESLPATDLQDLKTYQAIQEFTHRNYPKSEYMKGKFHLERKDYATALLHFKASAARGYSAAIYQLGVFYREGWADLPQDTEKAKSFFEAAFTKNYSLAAAALAKCYKEEHNFAKAMAYDICAILLESGKSREKMDELTEVTFVGGRRFIQPILELYKDKIEKLTFDQDLIKEIMGHLSTPIQIPPADEERSFSCSASSSS